MTLAGNVNKQLKRMIADGVPIQDAAACLNLSVEAAQLAMMGEDRTKISIAEVIEKARPEMIEILLDVARNGERDADRVKAAQIILEGKGVMPEVNAAAATRLLEHFENMKRAVSFIDVPTIASTDNKDTSMEMTLAFGK